MPDEIEHRAAGNRSELRIDGTAQSTTIEGYAAVFNSESEPLDIFGGVFVERIAPGAFKRSLSDGADVRALVDHDPSRIIGRRKAGTLEVREDPRGLKVSIKPPDTSAGRDLVASIRRGDVDQMSFGFRTIKDQWEEKEDGTTERTLLDVDLLDVSAVTFPAYADTTIAVRSMQRWQDRGEKVREKIKMAGQYVVDIFRGTQHGRDHDSGGSAESAGRAS